MTSVEQLAERIAARRDLPPPAMRRALREAAGLSRADVAGAVGCTAAAVRRRGLGEAGRHLVRERVRAVGRPTRCAPPPLCVVLVQPQPHRRPASAWSPAPTGRPWRPGDRGEAAASTLACGGRPRPAGRSSTTSTRSRRGSTCSTCARSAPRPAAVVDSSPARPGEATPKRSRSKLLGVGLNPGPTRPLGRGGLGALGVSRGRRRGAQPTAPSPSRRGSSSPTATSHRSASSATPHCEDSPSGSSPTSSTMGTSSTGGTPRPAMHGSRSRHASARRCSAD